MDAATARADDCDPTPDFLPRLPREYFNRQIDLVNLGRARLLAEPKFIKPIADKFFPAAVYELGAQLDVGPDKDVEPVLVSDPVEWEQEYRMFVCDNQLKTYSPYSPRGNALSAEELSRDALAFSTKVLGDTRVRLPRAVVLDVPRGLRGEGRVLDVPVRHPRDGYQPHDDRRCRGGGQEAP